MTRDLPAFHNPCHRVYVKRALGKIHLESPFQKQFSCLMYVFSLDFYGCATQLRQKMRVTPADDGFIAYTCKLQSGLIFRKRRAGIKSFYHIHGANQRSRILVRAERMRQYRNRALRAYFVARLGEIPRFHRFFQKQAYKVAFVC